MSVLSPLFSSISKVTLAVSIASFSLISCAEATTNSNSTTNTSNKNSSTEKVSSDDVISKLQKNLKASGIESNILSATATDINGLYWVTAESTPPFLADAEGVHIFQGQVIAVGDEAPVDVTAKLNSTLIKDKLTAVDESEMIIFPAEGEKLKTIYVFTDPTCPYCRKFHGQVTELNKSGVEVRYLAWPRSQQALPIMESIWCSENPNEAMTKSMNSLPIDNAKSCTSPVRSQTELGYAIGVSGTPAVYNEEGEQLGGYLPTQQLLSVLGIK